MTLFSKARLTLKYLRLRPFDTSNAAGREQERHRRIAISSVAAFIGQGVNYLVMIALVPLLLNYLGKEQYGLWLAISSVSAFSVFADLGIGNGVINVLGKAHGLQNRELARKVVSSSFFMLMGVAAVLAAGGWAVLPRLDWVRFFQLQGPRAPHHAAGAVYLFCFLFVLNLPLALVSKVQMACQENHLNSMWQAAGKLGMLAGVAAGVMTDRSLIYFVGVLAGTPVLMNGLNSLYLFGRHRPWLKPSITCFSGSSSRELLSTGAFFFITGISGVLAFQVDALVIGRFLGAEKVPVYIIPLQLIMIATTLLGFVLTPLWPAYREAVVRKDWDWVRKTFRRSLGLTFSITLPFVLVVLLAAPEAVQIWTGHAMQIPYSLLVALGIHALMTALTGPMAMIMNGANIIGIRALVSTVNGVFNLGLSIFLVQRVGIAGPVIATIVAQLLISWPISIYYIRRLFREAERNGSDP